METKHKTLLEECRDKIAVKYKFDNWENFSEHCWENRHKNTFGNAIDEAAELYAGQTKQSELVSLEVEQFIDKWYRGSITPKYQMSNMADVEKREMKNDLIDLIAKMYIKRLTDIEKNKKSISIDSICTILSSYAKDGYNETETVIHENNFYEAALKILQSQQPASVAFLSDEEINSLFPKEEGQAMMNSFQTEKRRACKDLQSELRKRVIDPVEFAKKSFYEFLEWHKQQGFISIKPGDFEEYLTHKTKDNE